MLYVYAQTGQVSIGDTFEDRTWIAFYYLEVQENSRRKFLGTVLTDFPVKFPLTLDNGVVINEDDYYLNNQE
jgi:hypothetical protein